MLTLTRPWQFNAERARDADRFSDVGSTDWYYPYVGNAVTLSWVQGYSDGTFKPNKSVNRVEALKMSMWAYGIENYLSNKDYNWIDVETNAWYSPYFISAEDKKLLPMEHIKRPTVNPPIPGSYYYPNSCMARGEVAELLYRIKAMSDNNVASFTTELLPTNIPASN